MTTFRKDMEKFIDLVHRRERLLYDGVVRHVQESILYGSATTGAPGQPIDSGDLIRSWTAVRKGIRAFEVTTSLHYAPIIEDNRRKATLRSKYGGFHSVKITYLNYRWLVRHELRKAKAAAP